MSTHAEIMQDYYGDIERRSRIISGGRRVLLDEETGRMRAFAACQNAFEVDPPGRPRRKRRVEANA